MSPEDAIICELEAKLEEAGALIANWRKAAAEIDFAMRDPALRQHSRDLLEQATHSIKQCADELEAALSQVGAGRRS